jgi:hypothetical protein
VVMGSQDRYADARAILEEGFASYSWLRPDTVAPYPLPVLVRDTADAIVPRWQASQILEFVDQDAMSASFTVAGRELLKVPVEALP